MHNVVEEGVRVRLTRRAGRSLQLLGARLALAGERIPLVALASVVLAAVIVFLLVIGQVAFQIQDDFGNKTYSLGNFQKLYSDPFVYSSFLNTVVFAAVALWVALAFGIPIAWLTERTNLPARGWVLPLLSITLLVPSFFSAMGWVILLHPRIGIINRLLVEILPIDHSPLNIVSLVGMGLVQGITLTPLAFLMIAASFRAMDPSLEESARVHGIPFLARLWKINIPLMKPGIFAAVIFVLAITVSAFDIPATIGLSNRIFTFSTFVYHLALPWERVPDYGLIGASSAVVLTMGLLLTWRYMLLIGQSHRYAVIRGKDYRVDLFVLGKWSILGWSIVGAVIILSVILPLLALLWVSMIPYLQTPSISAFQTMSLDNFRAVPWTHFLTGLRNSAILLFSVPTITLTLGLAISWIVIRSRSWIRGPFDVLAFLPHVIPNIIFAVGAFLLVITWLPTEFSVFERSIGIIILVYVVTQISFATRMLNSGLIQIHEELDEAGYVAGLGPVGVIRRILVPILAPTLLYSWLWIGLLAFRELTMAAFLANRGNLTLSVTIWTWWNGGRLNEAAAAALVFVGLLAPLVMLYYVVGRRHISMPQ